MNTFRDNLEHQIKKQIEEREIAPSRDLWSEIELQKEKPHSKFQMNWLLMAACLVLVFGLGFILFSNSSEKNNIQNVQITKVKENSPQEKATEKATENTISEPVYAEKKIIQETQEASTKTINEVVQRSPKVLAEQTQKTAPKDEAQVIITPETSKISVSADKVMAKTEDAVKTPVKRKKYVDPATLLFSVEHKDVIEKTKESNVATVDLNGR
ncbi:hypothetical protein [Chryseobacterium taiwanense]|uniref:Uncharacterized protein n=1 Tax=Chryseobacterium taiwanense TaxID=363331 RepID=A0A0B4CME8_9FLAO|nr:hypothetical protein [Chryseobacterium taiwanense]KIC62444.1 hypothetical protein RM51_13010 [Chryseobacterium taiwanense]